MTKATLLLNWVKLKHDGQMVKLTDKPYLDHLTAVANMAKPCTKFGYEVGLCHDLLEKTNTSEKELNEALFNFGYSGNDAAVIIGQVIELTDVFTKKAYPNLAKVTRKDKEAVRLSTISAGAQTVKYCDLMYNIDWVMRYDRTNAKDYLEKKRLLLYEMDGGDQTLRSRAIELTNVYLAAITIAFG